MARGTTRRILSIRRTSCGGWQRCWTACSQLWKIRTATIWPMRRRPAPMTWRTWSCRRCRGAMPERSPISSTSSYTAPNRRPERWHSAPSERRARSATMPGHRSMQSVCSAGRRRKSVPPGERSPRPCGRWTGRCAIQRTAITSRMSCAVPCRSCAASLRTTGRRCCSRENGFRWTIMRYSMRTSWRRPAPTMRN